MKVRICFFGANSGLFSGVILEASREFVLSPSGEFVGPKFREFVGTFCAEFIGTCNHSFFQGLDVPGCYFSPSK